MSEKSEAEVKEFPRRIEIFFILLASLLAFGTISFKLIKNISFKDSFFMTIQSFAFMFGSASGLEKILQIFLATFGLILIWWTLWSVFDLLLEGNLTEYLKMHKVLSKLKKMRQHYIIAGGGRVGEEIVKDLYRRKKECIVIEKDEVKVNNLKKKGFFVIHGDVSEEAVLKEAGIKNARAIILAMPETEKNLLVTMIAKEINPSIEVYARADKPAFISKLKKAGAKIVVVPEIVAAEKFLESIK